MKRAFAVTLLLMSFASLALADGPGMPPTGSATKPPKPGIVLLADGPGMPPGPIKANSQSPSVETLWQRGPSRIELLCGYTHSP